MLNFCPEKGGGEKPERWIGLLELLLDPKGETRVSKAGVIREDFERTRCVTSIETAAF